MPVGSPLWEVVAECLAVKGGFAGTDDKGDPGLLAITNVASLNMRSGLSVQRTPVGERGRVGRYSLH